MTAVLAVVIAAHNEAPRIGRCLASLASQLEGLEVIVVDDDSSDGTAEAALAAMPEVRVLRVPHGGPGAARNAGIAEATAPRVAFLDADCAVHPGWAAVAARPGVPQEVRMGRSTALPGALDRLVALSCFGEFCGARPRVLNGFATLNVAGSTALFRAHPFPELPAGEEDRILSWRMHRAGVSILYDPGMVVEHAPPTDFRTVLRRQVSYARRVRTIRRREPSLPGARLARWPAPIGGPALAAARLVRDLGRLREAADGLGIPRVQQPLYALALAGWRFLDLVVLSCSRG
ncbi:MAG: glycosyltransferase family 2 protein [Planctomycetota bacterium]